MLTCPRSVSPIEQAREFFAAHDWCLNPILTVHDLRRRIGECWQLRAQAREDWQRQACDVNLYLLLCGLSCTIDDCLAYRSWRLRGLTQRLDRLGALGAVASRALEAAHDLFVAVDRKQLRSWKPSLDRCVEAACRTLLEPDGGAGPHLEALGKALPVVLEARLPGRTRIWRMRIPEAFRCQDLGHPDVVELARLAAEELRAETGRPFLAVGVRTAGAYFAPLLSAVLERQGFRCMGVLTVRPKEGPSAAELRALRSGSRAGARILVIDDHQNTGRTMALMVELLRRVGARSEDLLFLAPDHPAQSDWHRRVAPARAVALPPERAYKARLLRDDAYLSECLSRLTGTDCTVLHPDPLVRRINAEFEQQWAASFDVRHKRLLTVRVAADRSTPERMLVLAKSVGWGWLSYHASLAADRLGDFVPPLLGLRDGILFTRWVGTEAWPPTSPAIEEIAEKVPAYLAARVRQLSFGEDRTLGGMLGYRWTGRDAILAMLRKPYGSLASRIGKNGLDRKLGAFGPPRPVLVDGRMRVAEWVQDPSGVRKVDFEHHNFGGRQEDLSDPAYDLAGAIFALKLSHRAEERMLAQYIALTGDEGIRDRLLIFKLLVGQAEMDAAAAELRRSGSREQEQLAHLRFSVARSFLTSHLARHHASRIEVPNEPAWTSRLFLLDLDGVFDIQGLGFFPHTTEAGLVALRLLQEHGFSVVPCTGRSASDVESFCQVFGLPGGIAEFGCVLVDCVSRRVERRCSPEAGKALQRCREMLGTLPGVYVDPGYTVAVRVYRNQGDRWSGLTHEEIDAGLRAGGLDHVEAIREPADTVFVPRGVDKLSGVLALKAWLPRAPSLVAAMGDSTADLPLLKQADRAFAPAGAAEAIHAFARAANHVRIARRPAQRGLLESVERLLAEVDGADRAPREVIRGLVGPARNVVDLALRGFDKSSVGRGMAVLSAQFSPPYRRH
jgi:hydroxymethylpyrimidine pyrophosphatase-like HAD family hydrolase